MAGWIKADVVMCLAEFGLSLSLEQDITTFSGLGHQAEKIDVIIHKERNRYHILQETYIGKNGNSGHNHRT